VYKLTGRNTQSNREMEVAGNLDPDMVRMQNKLE